MDRCCVYECNNGECNIALTRDYYSRDEKGSYTQSLLAPKDEDIIISAVSDTVILDYIFDFTTSV